MNHSFDREISFVPRTSDFCYDVFVHGSWVASARYQGAGDLIADEVCYAHVLAHPAINPIHLNDYTVVLSQPGETFCYEIRTLCDACRAQTANASKMGEVINGYCDGCGVGPSVPHIPLLHPDPATLIIRAAAPAQLAACVADTPLAPIGPCYVCGNPAWQADAAGPLCTEHAGVLAMFEGERAVRPIAADALLAEADAALPQHPGPRCDCPACQRATDRLADAAMMYRLCLEAGLLCQYCGEAHADAACPQRQSVLPTVQPTHCGNCGGRHSIQQCSDIRRLLFAA